MDNAYRILLAIGLKTGTGRLLAEAQRYGRALNAVIDVIHVSELDPDFAQYIKSPRPEEQTSVDSGRESRPKALRAEHQQTHAFGAALRASGVRLGQTLTVQGPTFETILAHVRKLDSDMLLLGSHQHGALYRLWYENTPPMRPGRHHAPC